MKKHKKEHMIDIIPQNSISQPQISPDGKKILFTHTKLNKKKDSYNSSINIISSNGKTLKQFTYGDSNDNTSKWSPDGKKVIFISDRYKLDEENNNKSKKQIWIATYNGTKVKMLTSSSGNILGSKLQSPSWSPDGKKILFLCRTYNSLKIQNNNFKTIDNLNYKRDGIGFLHNTNIHLFVIDLKNRKVKQLTRGEFDVQSPIWSPNSSNIAFVTNLKEEISCNNKKDVWLISDKGGTSHKIFEDIYMKSPSLAWSPNGENLAYLSIDTTNHNNRDYKYNKIFIKSFEYENTVNLTKNFDKYIGSHIEWSNDSKALYFLATDHASNHIYKIELNNFKVTNITDGKMTVQDFSINNDNTLFAYTATNQTITPEIWSYDLKEKKQITNFSNKILNNFILVKPDEFWFVSSDNIKIQGWIMKPIGYKKGNRYPTILQIHGGRWSNYNYHFNLLFQFLLNNGYCVVTLNHRGSVGYGEAFTDWKDPSEKGNYPSRAFKDLIESIDFIVTNYDFLDPNRIGVTGCSAGGYLTNWIITHSNRFKAAVTVASISNWYSMYGCSDNGPCSTIAKDLSNGKEPWNASDIYLAASPISYVEKVQTPLLIIHGENDLRCPIEQAEQLFSALKKLGKTVKFIRFTGEPHVNIHTMKKPSHTREALHQTLEWFDKYLK